MEYSVDLVIDLPRARVVELFDNQENLKKWQKGLEVFEHVSGEPGTAGAKSHLVYDMNGRKVEMTETITSITFPDEFSATYEADGVKNWIVNRFVEIGPSQTRWETDNIFEFGGFMRIMAFFMPGMFKRQTLSTMKDFKTFAENA